MTSVPRVPPRMAISGTTRDGMVSGFLHFWWRCLLVHNHNIHVHEHKPNTNPRRLVGVWCAHQRRAWDVLPILPRIQSQKSKRRQTSESTGKCEFRRQLEGDVCDYWLWWLRGNLFRQQLGRSSRGPKSLSAAHLRPIVYHWSDRYDAIVALAAVQKAKYNTTQEIGASARCQRRRRIETQCYLIPNPHILIILLILLIRYQRTHTQHVIQPWGEKAIVKTL